MNDIKNLTLSLAIEIVELVKINQLNYSGKRLGKSGIGNESIIGFFPAGGERGLPHYSPHEIIAPHYGIITMFGGGL